MVHLIATKHKEEQGFTLLEIIVVLVIASVLAAISAPSLLGWYNRNKLNEATTELQGVLKQAQRNAIRQSADCIVDLTSGTSNPTISSDCETANVTLDRVTIRHNVPGNTTRFDYRGEIDPNSAGTIVLSVDNAIDQTCVVISPGIGLFRSGNYDTSDTSGTTAGNCTTEQFKSF